MVLVFDDKQTVVYWFIVYDLAELILGNVYENIPILIVKKIPDQQSKILRLGVGRMFSILECVPPFFV